MKIRSMLAVIVSVLILLGLSGCGKEASTGMAAADNSYMAPEAKEEVAVNTESAALPENRKLIQTVRISLETKDLNTVLQQIDARVAELGGYTENSNIQNGSAYSGSQYRNASLTIRIPAKELDAFLDNVSEISNVVSSQKNVNDITLSYVATESRMKALQTEEARLLELMAQAETMDDLLTVEKRLTEVRTELEKVTSALKVYDNQVDYATVHLSIEEVQEYTETEETRTVWERIGSGFSESLLGVGNFLKELFIFIVVAIPYLVLLGVIALSIVLIIRFSIRRKRKNREKKAASKETPQKDTED